jgi:phytoene dehydrogenase-like protein
MELIAHALRLRRLADRDLLELLRLVPLPVADWMDDTFANPLLQAGLAYDGVVHTFLGPRSAGSSATLLIKAATTNAAVQGGPGALLATLTSAARAAGVDLRTNAEATRVQVEEGRVTAVELGDGSTLPADAVLFACHPRVGLFDLVEPRQLDPQLAHDLEHHRSRGTTALLHLALDELPAALSEALRTPNGAGPITRLRTSPSLEHLELAFNGIRYGELPEHPALEVTIPTLRDERTPDGAPLAPAGSHVLTIRASFVPSSGWTPALRDELQTSLLSELAPHIPDLGSNTLAAHLVTPADLERDFNLPGGDIHHGEHALDQFMGLRPAPGHARHTLPIRGLFLASGGTHPGGGLTGSPGHLAARAALG